MLKIYSNHQWRPLIYGYDVPPDVRSDRFDWLEDSESSDGFIKYRNDWFHLSEFVRISTNPTGFEYGAEPGTALTKWHGINVDSYSTALVIKVSDDMENYKIGMAIAQSDGPNFQRGKIYGVSVGDGNDGVSHLHYDYSISVPDGLEVYDFTNYLIRNLFVPGSYRWAKRNVMTSGEPEYTFALYWLDPPKSPGWSEHNGSWKIIEVFPLSPDDIRERPHYELTARDKNRNR